jgi:hypothetical protein
MISVGCVCKIEKVFWSIIENREVAGMKPGTKSRENAFSIIQRNHISSENTKNFINSINNVDIGL